MKKIFTTEEMSCRDRAAMQMGLSSPVLMERAALAVYDVIKEKGLDRSAVLVLAGPGNNGGDGLAVARLLAEDGFSPSVMLLFPEETGSEQQKNQLALLRHYPVSFVKEYVSGKYSLIVDAVFGIGLSRNIEGKIADLFAQINADPVPVAAVDIASGVEGNTGKLLGAVLRADFTVTFAAAKIGHLFYPGAEAGGELIVRQIGIPLWEDWKIRSVDETDLKNLPAADESGNKGTFGKLLVIAGSKKMCGAAYLCAAAALKSGIGMVRIFTHEENRTPLSVLLPESIITCYNEKNYEKSMLEEALAWADAAVAGPGLSKAPLSVRILNDLFALNCEKPVVLDADALNIVSEDLSIPENAKAPLVLTPHLGEMSRLCRMEISAIKEDRLKIAADFSAKYSVTLVLKDAVTVTAYPDGSLYINSSGNSALATAGSGDVLAGIIAAFKLRYQSSALPLEALAVYRHGLLGDALIADQTKESVTAQDLVRELNH